MLKYNRITAYLAIEQF